MSHQQNRRKAVAPKVHVARPKTSRRATNTYHIATGVGQRRQYSSSQVKRTSPAVPSDEAIDTDSDEPTQPAPVSTAPPPPTVKRKSKRKTRVVSRSSCLLLTSHVVRSSVRSTGHYCVKSFLMNSYVAKVLPATSAVSAVQDVPPSRRMKTCIGALIALARTLRVLRAWWTRTRPYHCIMSR